MLIKLIFSICFVLTSSIQWLGISQHRYTWSHRIDCYSARRDGFSSEQIRFCREYFDLMPYIHTTSREVIEICLKLFRYHHWNCSSLLFAPHFTIDLRLGTVEQAFLQALTSALLMQKFSRLCALNQTNRCSCQLTHSTFYQRNGCNDNLEFGLKFSRLFIEGRMNLFRKQTSKYRSSEYKLFLMAITHHNHALGRQLVKQNLKRKCKCSGLSGSCTIRTCWQEIISAEKLAIQLKHRYKRAIEVLPNLFNNDPLHPQFLPENPSHIRRIHSNDLLYWIRSPDYCQTNHLLFHTHGRQCNKSLSNSSEGSCDYLCCGRGYVTRSIWKENYCHCRYVHCCSIQCDRCFEQIEENICK